MEKDETKPQPPTKGLSVSQRGTCGFSHYEVSVLIPHIFPRCWSILVLHPKLQAQSSETFEGGVTVDFRTVKGVRPEMHGVPKQHREGPT